MDKKARPERAKRGRFWVVFRHHHQEVVEAQNRPPVENKKGMRKGGVKGPYASKEAAQEAADKRAARTLPAILERGEA